MRMASRHPLYQAKRQTTPITRASAGYPSALRASHLLGAVLEACAAKFPIERLSGHFHDTYGQAIANIYASLEVGISIFHSATAGLGGCPYAKGATGNVATEDVLYLLQGLGIETGVDLGQVVAAGQWISAALNKLPISRAGNAIHAVKAA